MHVSVETTSGLERKLTIDIPAIDVDNIVGKKLSELAKTIKLDGFRKGKVPAKVIQQRFGAGVRQEAIGDLMRDNLFKAIEQENLQPVAQPLVQTINDKAGTDVTFTATFEIAPEFEIKDLAGIEVEQTSAEIKDEDLQDVLVRLQKDKAEWVDADKAAESGDQISLDFEGFVNNEPFEGNKAEGFDIVIGSNQMIPGFEDGLKGLKAGDEKDIEVTFPENYQHKDLAGKPALFKIKAHAVKSPKLHEINDDFAKLFDVEDGLDTLKQEISKNLSRELETKLKQINKEKLFDKLIELNSIELPNAMLDEEIKSLQQDMVQRMTGGQQQVDMSKLPQMPREMFEDRARRRVNLTLLISKFVKKHELTVDKAKLHTMIDDIAQSYEKPDEVHEWFRKNPNQMMHMETAALEEQVCEELIKQATLKETQKSFKEVMEPVDPKSN